SGSAVGGPIKCSPPTIAPRSATAPASGGPAFITTPPPGRRGRRSSFAMVGGRRPGGWLHPPWGGRGLRLGAWGVVGAKDVAPLTKWYPDLTFRTKLELAADLVRWAAERLRFTGQTLWLVVDGAYAKRPFVREVLAVGATLVSRLRKDAALRSLPTV